MTPCEVRDVAGNIVAAQAIEHRRWRRAMHEPRWGASQAFLSMLGLLCIGDGTAAYAKGVVEIVTGARLTVGDAIRLDPIATNAEHHIGGNYVVSSAGSGMAELVKTADMPQNVSSLGRDREGSA
jgi:hypothetical protein